MPSEVVMFKRGREWARDKLGPAVAAALTDTADQMVAHVTDGMTAARNSVERKISKKGIEYYAGEGAPLGGYPGIRTGQLWQSINSVAALVSRNPVAKVVSAVPYAGYVHNYLTGEPKRPFFDIPVRDNSDSLRNAFVNKLNQGLG